MIENLQKEIDKLKADLDAAKAEIQHLTNQIPVKSRIVVCKEWHNPDISIEYNHIGIRLQIQAEDYIKAIIKNIEWVFPKGMKRLVNWHHPKKEDLEKAMIEQLLKIENEMKNCTKLFPPAG